MKEEIKSDFVSEGARYRKIDPVSDDLSSIDAWEYEGDEFSNAYIEVDDFENMLGYTLDDVTDWLNDRYYPKFNTTKVEEFEYGDGWILFRRRKGE